MRRFVRKTLKATAAGMALAAVAIPTARSEITLTDAQGHKATVEVTEASSDTVSILLQGRKSSVKIANLSEASRAEVVAYAKSKNVYRSCPPLIVQVKVAKQQRNADGSWYQKNVKVNSSVIVEGVNKLIGLPALEATIVIVTQDTRQKYVKHVEKLTVEMVDTIPIPIANVGTRRELDFKTVELTLDSARDATNLGGREYKYFVFGLRDTETKQFLDFQTNCPPLQAYITAHPEARETLLSARRNASFSTDFSER